MPTDVVAKPCPPPPRRDLSRDPESRRLARSIRDRQWDLMEAMRHHRVLWICPWNKRRLPEQPDERRYSLLGWVQIASRFEDHADWFTIGDWDDARDARPYSLTAAGLAALENRALHDREPVRGGLVEPGWQAIPARRHARKEPQP